jgi:hypothetical protein
MDFTVMKLSTVIPLLGAISIATLNTSCLESKGAAEKPAEQTPENGAQFKKGQGLSLTEKMSKAIGLKVEDVGEKKVAPVISLTRRSRNQKETGVVSFRHEYAASDRTIRQGHQGNHRML